MATKPGIVPRWATDAGRTVQPPENGALTTSKDVGFLNATRPPARFLNWLLNTIYIWILYLQDLNNQPFNAAGYGAWTKTHEFTPTTANARAAVFQGNGTAEGIYVAGGGTNGTAISAEANGNGIGINVIAPGNNVAGFFENNGGGGGIYVTAGPDANGIGGEFTGGGSGGTGVKATAGLNGAAGLQGIGNGTGNSRGVIGTGSGTGTGGYFTGGSGGAHGVEGYAIAGNANGGLFTGFGSGSGVQAAGGTTGAGGTFTGGSSAKPGVLATGGSGGNGITANGTAAGAGGQFTGGAAGVGVSCTGGGTNFALVVGTGNAHFTGTQPAKNTALTTNTVTATHIAKAWGKVQFPSGTATLQDGVNVSGISAAGSSIMTMTFATPMANDDYDVGLTQLFNPTTGSANIILIEVVDGSQTVNDFDIRIYNIDLVTGAYSSGGSIVFGTGRSFSFRVFARQ